MQQSVVLQSSQALSFGDFELFPAERTLLERGRPIHLGGRAFEILMALTDRPGQVVTKQDLIERVWPGLAIDDGTIRVQVAALRRALKDGQEGRRYIDTSQGRGYAFVVPVSLLAKPYFVEPAPADRQANNLPPSTQLVGRNLDLEKLIEQISSHRLVTVLGTGGIGKTTIAVAAAHRVSKDFLGDVHFFDLAAIRDPFLLANAIVSTLGLVQSDDPLPGLLSFLREKARLLVFDSCEHLRDAVSALVRRIIQDARATSILATSREALGVDGEQVWAIGPLECPPDDRSLTIDEVKRFPAVELFIGKMKAAGRAVELRDEDALPLIEICRKLDGIALALEFAAGRVGTLGLTATAELIGKIRWLGGVRRAAAPRHQTLAATLEWSYQLLLDKEQEALERLSVLVGPFTSEAGISIAGGRDDSEESVHRTLGSLVDKSLIVADQSKDDRVAFRMLDTTRAYAWDKLVERREADEISRRHSIYFLELLECRINVSASTARQKIFSDFGPHLANVRAALEWSLADGGDLVIGKKLVAAASRLFLELSLLVECSRWSARAIESLKAGEQGTEIEMQLQAALGFSSIFTKGNSSTAGKALARALDIAVKLKDLNYQCGLLCRLHVYHERVGEFRTGLSYALRAGTIANEIDDQMAFAEAQMLLGLARLHEGQCRPARLHLDAALQGLPSTPRPGTYNFGSFDYDLGIRNNIARIMWLEGFPDQAAAYARLNVEQALAFRHPVTDSISLIFGACLFLWNRNFDDAEACIEGLIRSTDRHSLAPYHAAGNGLKGEYLIRTGKAEEGISQLQDALAALHRTRYELLTSSFLNALAEGMAMAGRVSDAVEIIDEAIETIERNGDFFVMPESLRLKAEILMAIDEDMVPIAEGCLRRALDLADEQGASAWQLRTATSWALILMRKGRHEEARKILIPRYDSYTEGYFCHDVVKARDVIERLGQN